MDKTTTSVISSTLAIAGLICKLMSHNKNQKIKFIESATELTDTENNKNEIKPCYLNTILETDSPITLKLQDIKWLYVKNKTYIVNNRKKNYFHRVQRP